MREDRTILNVTHGDDFHTDTTLEDSREMQMYRNTTPQENFRPTREFVSETFEQTNRFESLSDCCCSDTISQENSLHLENLNSDSPFGCGPDSRFAKNSSFETSHVMYSDCCSRDPTQASIRVAQKHCSVAPLCNMLEPRFSFSRCVKF